MMEDQGTRAPRPSGAGARPRWRRLAALCAALCAFALAGLGTRIAEAQTYPARVLCSTTTGSTSTPGLGLFAGNYTLVRAEAADSTDREVLAGFARMSIPSWIGGSGGYGTGNHGNFTWGGAPEWYVEWDNLGYAGSDLGEEFRRASNAGWCTGADNGLFYFRGAVQQDLRWESKDVLTVAYCRALPGFLGGGPRCARRYVGIGVRPALLPGTGFPVQRYTVDNAAGAVDQARQLYEEWNRRRQMAFSTYEVELWGEVRTSPVMCRKRWWWFGWRERWYECGIALNRRLVGEMRRRLYQDQRLGVIDTVGGAEFRMTVEFAGRAVTGTGINWGRLENRVTAFCGSPAGCGGGWPATIAEGSLHVEGSDDSTQFRKMCRQWSGGRECYDTTNVALNDSLAPNTGRVDSALTSRGTTGPPMTEAERVSNLEGTRGDPGAPKAPDEWSRMCERNIGQDSIDVVNGPIPEGDPFPTAPSRDSAAYAACLTSGTPPAPVRPPSARAAAGRANGVAGPGRGSRQPLPPNCRIVMGQPYCVPVRRSAP